MALTFRSPMTSTLLNSTKLFKYSSIAGAVHFFDLEAIYSLVSMTPPSPVCFFSHFSYWFLLAISSSSSICFLTSSLSYLISAMASLWLILSDITSGEKSELSKGLSPKCSSWNHTPIPPNWLASSDSWVTQFSAIWPLLLNLYLRKLTQIQFQRSTPREQI